MEKIQKAMTFLFYGLFLLTPLILFEKTSEIFEFNKTVFIYSMSLTLTALWIAKMILAGKFVFKRTLLDWPLLIFIFSQVLSTIFSIDPHTSIFGYYSRFNGGLLSVISFSLIYWIFVSNMDKVSTLKSIRFLFFSTLLTSVWGIFEHFGRSFSCLIFPDFGVFDNSCWVQDVQNRVFSSFGQPNWLASWLVAVIPVTWGYRFINHKDTNDKEESRDKLNLLINAGLFSVFFVTLLFTRSRSGILAFAASFIVFLFFYIFRVTKKASFRYILFLLILPTVVFSGIFGTPWSGTVFDMLSSKNTVSAPPPSAGPALETGGTESGKIRQIVWKGAVDVWKAYPVFGSGVETFAYSYYQYRPVEHNMVSEWDYLYNKAHNEYLNFAATTGTVGIFSYLAFIVFACLQLIGFTKKDLIKFRLSNLKTLTLHNDALNYSFLAGFIGILITNFFGFSTAGVNLLFYILPAMGICLNEASEELKTTAPDTGRKMLLAFLIVFYLVALNWLANYWYTDYLYARGRIENESGDLESARTTLANVVKRSPNEPIYWDELADNSTQLAMGLLKKGDKETAVKLAQSASNESTRSINLSPANVNLKRKTSSRLITLAEIDGNYGASAKNILEEAVIQAPTDPKIFYSLSYVYLKLGSYEKAIPAMEKAVSLKPDYEKARYSLAVMYEDVGQKEKAIEQLEILLKRNPTFTEAQKELDDLKKK